MYYAETSLPSSLKALFIFFNVDIMLLNEFMSIQQYTIIQRGIIPSATVHTVNDTCYVPKEITASRKYCIHIYEQLFCHFARGRLDIFNSSQALTQSENAISVSFVTRQSVCGLSTTYGKCKNFSFIILLRNAETMFTEGIFSR